MDAPNVAVDGFHAAKEIIRYLIGLRHTQIGRISGPSDRTSSAADRLEGYQKILREAGLEPSWTFSTEYKWSPVL